MKGERSKLWTEIKKAPNLMVAEMWKEFFEGEGIPTQIVPLGGGPPTRELVEYQILVPADKHSMIKEVLRTL
jgi:hypothetical protein